MSQFGEEGLTETRMSWFGEEEAGGRSISGLDNDLPSTKPLPCGPRPPPTGPAVFTAG